MSKLQVALLFGGKSPEHEISVISARNIYNAMNKSLYEVTLIGIAKNGKWYLETAENHQESGFVIGAKGRQIAVVPGNETQKFMLLDTNETLPDPQVVFPITHGPNGEDGTLQGLLTQLELPFVGPGVLGSAAAMDKDVCKRLFIQSGIDCAPGIVMYKSETDYITYEEVCAILGEVVFVKPANMGSSIGVSRADNKASFEKAVADAFLYDTKILVEKAIIGRELECAVLGNEHPEASAIGEIVMSKGFYDFEAKYISADEAQLYIPARDLDEETTERIRQTAIQAYLTLGLEGLTRVDVFLTPDGDILVNEVNTLPGFTSISMYPKLWEAEGLAYSNLIDKLLQLAIDRYQRNAQLKTDNQ